MKSVGKYRIITEQSHYVVDFDAQTLVRERMAEDAAHLRLDTTPVKLLRIIRAEVGDRMHALLQIRDDGTTTIRISSPIREIVQLA